MIISRLNIVTSLILTVADKPPSREGVPMTSLHTTGLFLLAILLALSPVREAGAEWILDVYGGVAMTDDEAVTGTGSSQTATQNVSFDDGISLGVRGAYWFERLPQLGLGTDLSYFEADGGAADFDIVGFSFLIMARLPLLRDDRFPKGRFQPYVGFGPGLFSIFGHADFRPAVSNEIDTNGSDFGLDARAGLAFHLSPLIALFAEYRYTEIDVDIDDGDAYLTFADEFLSTKLKTHHLLTGISFRF